MPSQPGSGWAEEEVRRVKANFTFENFEGQVEVSSEAGGLVIEAFPHTARDEDLSLAMLQGVRPSPVGLYQPSVLGRWFPWHTPDVAALWHRLAG